MSLLINTRNFTKTYRNKCQCPAVCLPDKLRFSLVIFFCIGLFAGCEPENNPDQSKDEPDNNGLFVKTDTVTFNIETIRSRSVRSDEFSRDLLGTYTDTTFGLSRSSLVTEFRLPGSGLDFGKNPQIDSVILHLVYGGKNAYFGNLNTIQNIYVYELNQRIYRDKEYQSGESFDHQPEPMGTWKGKFHPAREVLNISIDQEAFLKKFEQASQNQLTNKEDFLQFFKGILLAPQDNFKGNRQGAIVYFMLETDSSGITFYYNDTARSSLLINSNCARIDLFAHDYSGTPANHVSSGNRFFLQPMAGLKAHLQLPYLENFVKDAKIAVHKAQFIFTPGKNLPYELPPRLLLLGANKNKEEQTIVDLFESGYGGDLNIDSGAYEFNIPLHFQYLLNNYERNPGFKDYGLILKIPLDRPALANPLVFTNKERKKGVDLILSYTKYRKK